MGRGSRSAVADEILFGDHLRSTTDNVETGRLGNGLSDDKIMKLPTITKEYRYTGNQGEIEVSFREFAEVHIQSFNVALDEAECLLAGEDVINEDDQEDIFEHYSLPEKNREALQAQLQILEEREPDLFF